MLHKLQNTYIYTHKYIFKIDKEICKHSIQKLLNKNLSVEKNL